MAEKIDLQIAVLMGFAGKNFAEDQDRPYDPNFKLFHDQVAALQDPKNCNSRYINLLMSLCEQLISGGFLAERLNRMDVFDSEITRQGTPYILLPKNYCYVCKLKPFMTVGLLVAHVGTIAEYFFNDRMNEKTGSLWHHHKALCAEFFLEKVDQSPDGVNPGDEIGWYLNNYPRGVASLPGKFGYPDGFWEHLARIDRDLKRYKNIKNPLCFSQQPGIKLKQ
jgi:hypothetical protein